MSIVNAFDWRHISQWNVSPPTGPSGFVSKRRCAGTLALTTAANSGFASSAGMVVFVANRMRNPWIRRGCARPAGLAEGGRTPPGDAFLVTDFFLAMGNAVSGRMRIHTSPTIRRTRKKEPGRANREGARPGRMDDASHRPRPKSLGTTCVTGNPPSVRERTYAVSEMWPPDAFPCRDRTANDVRYRTHKGLPEVPYTVESKADYRHHYDYGTVIPGFDMPITPAP